MSNVESGTITLVDGVTRIPPLLVSIPKREGGLIVPGSLAVDRFILDPMADLTVFELLAINCLFAATMSGVEVETLWADMSPNVKRHFSRLEETAAQDANAGE